MTQHSNLVLTGTARPSLQLAHGEESSGGCMQAAPHSPAPWAAWKSPRGCTPPPPNPASFSSLGSVLLMSREQAKQGLGAKGMCHAQSSFPFSAFSSPGKEKFKEKVYFTKIATISLIKQ